MPGFLKYAIAAVVIAFLIEGVDQYDHTTAVAMAVAIMLGVLLMNADKVESLFYPHSPNKPGIPNFTGSMGIKPKG